MKLKYKVLLTLTGLVTVSIHCINHLAYTISTKDKLLSTSLNKYFEWRFGKVNYTTNGIGTPILLIHNLTPGSSIYEFHKISRMLAKNHEVYSLNLLGYGLSDKPNMTYTNFLYVQLISDFIKNIIGKKVDIVATGDSAPIALMANHNDPEIINKMIFINPQDLYKCNEIPSKQTRLLKWFIDIPIFGTFLFNIIHSKHFILKSFINEYFFDPSNIDRKDIYYYSEAAHLLENTSKYSFSSYVGKYTNANILHALKEVNQSILIIAGGEIKDITSTIDAYTYYNIAIETEYLNKTKLLPHMENPEKVFELIETFFG
ncbi:MAG TPA: alpha/beta fold hydrolase [Lachnospiraceae bacterium]|nr:alpha/beta fold hydrolase [Lachnospiraceae bacterium]